MGVSPGPELTSREALRGAGAVICSTRSLFAAGLVGGVTGMSDHAGLAPPPSFALTAPALYLAAPPALPAIVPRPSTFFCGDPAKCRNRCYLPL